MLSRLFYSLTVIALGLALAGCQAVGTVAPGVGPEPQPAVSPIATVPVNPTAVSAMYRGGPARTGVFDTANVVKLNGLKWKFPTGGPVWSSPVLAGGILYIGSDDTYLYAIDAATGKQKWSFKTGDLVRSSPAVAGGLVLVHSDDDFLYALDAQTGEQQWKFATREPGGSFASMGIAYDLFTSSPVVANGIVYVGSQDPRHGLYALDLLTGQKRWTHDIVALRVVRSSPAVAGDLVYYGVPNGLYALDAATGQEKWELPNAGDMIYPPAVGGGLLFVGSRNANLYALDAQTGIQKWSLDLSGDSWVTSGPAIGDGVVYASTSVGQSLHAVSIETGKQLWQFNTAGWVWSSPALAKGVLYVGSGDHNLYAVDAATGAELWHYATEGEVYSSPAVLDGVVYVGSLDGSVYAIH